MSLLSSLNPYFTYIKIAAAAAVIIAAFLAGNTWATRKYEAEKVEVVERAAAEYKVSIDIMKAALVKQNEINSDVVARNQVLKAKLEVSQTQRRKEIRNATETYIDPLGKVLVQPAAIFTYEFGRVWNSAIERANQGVPGAGANPTGATGPDLRASDITRESILTNHDDILKQCGKWKADLDSIREWDAKTFKEK
jgi:hypothetical protein